MKGELERDPILLITGPTASGKSALAHKEALESGGEIISADSRQVYRELAIGTAKPSRQMQEEVPYHFIDEREVSEGWSAGAFAGEALRRIGEIEARGRRPIVVGGSTLYVQGLVEGFANLPPADPAVRQRLEKALCQEGPEHLYRRLQALDPRQARTLDPSKTHRLLRSLEVIELTGRSLSELQQERVCPGRRFDIRIIDRPREELYRRIDERVLMMMEEGLQEEAHSLWLRYREAIRERRIPALMSVGYQELFDYFGGKGTLEEATTLIQQHSRNYAKRQLTFLRNQTVFRSASWIRGKDA